MSRELALTPSRTDERKFAARCNSVRKHRAYDYESKRYADKHKSEAVFGMLTTSRFL